ncbi:L,D-transpeptidase family protein [Mesorhizobium marinum]|uniref:L,D-transpeptidase family protein n=1 Tax=Mesorhizobium marinum TaxID=3228790 RepID=UPI003467564E
MLRRTIVLSALLAGLATLGAEAAVPPAGDGAAVPAAAPTARGLQLAQYGDVEVYYDEFGRRVIIDAYTGEVIAVERPRRGERRQRRDEMRARRDARRGEQERYYLDDPEDMRRLREQKLRDAGIVARPPVDRYEDYSRQGLPGGIDRYPEAPRGRAMPIEPAPDVIAREPAPGPIERAPLDSPQARPESPSVAELPSATAPTIIEGAIDPSLKLGAREDVAALQILLDRRGASPGVIDGRFGSNVDKAIVAYRSITRENLKSTDAEGIKKALAESGGDPFVNYTITAADASGPFVASVPADYGAKAKLDKLSYTSVSEMLAERFHMDEAYLKALNPNANFGRVGTIIRVANIGKPATGAVARIVADKGRKQVFAYDDDNRLVVSYPATIGSTDTPSPTGTHLVSRVVLDPDYTYNPNVNFKQGDNDKILTIPPGPNGPVGSVWIALDKPTYGVHGTPDPSKIGKTESHGCVRLTNWDAQELAKMVKAGVPVEFVD